MKKIVHIITLILFVIVITTTTSCVGTMLKNQVGRSKFEMVNKIGAPNRILNISNGGQVYFYFYQDYSQNHYPSIVGIIYIDINEKVYKVDKYKTRLSLDEFLQYTKF
jgi:uncharacterized SAM-binding protein YcdF (DUF218 family)